MAEVIQTDQTIHISTYIYIYVICLYVDIHHTCKCVMCVKRENIIFFPRDGGLSCEREREKKKVELLR